MAIKEENKDFERSCLNTKDIEKKCVLVDTSEPITMYLESDLGQGKADYWTPDLLEAFVFESLNEALPVFKKVSYKGNVTIKEVENFAIKNVAIKKLKESSWRDLVVGEEVKVGDRFYNGHSSQWVIVTNEDVHIRKVTKSSFPFQRLVTQND